MSLYLSIIHKTKGVEESYRYLFFNKEETVVYRRRKIAIHTVFYHVDRLTAVRDGNDQTSVSGFKSTSKHFVNELQTIPV